jgi:hypothetical protein
MLLQLQPKKLFLIDGIGALASTFFLGILLVQLKSYVGMPASVLYVLAGIASIFAGYSLSCYALTPLKWSPYLKAIAIANAMYCCLTLGLVVYFYQQLSSLGLTYFSIEMIVIILLVCMEALAVHNSK